MLKTRKEVFEWLLKKQGGFYDELVKTIGVEMAKDLEVLGYIHKGYVTSTDKEGVSWELTERGKRMAKLIIKNKQRQKKYSLADVLRKILF